MGLDLNRYTVDKKVNNMLLQNFPYHPMPAFSRGDAWFVDAENGDDNAGGRDIWTPVKTIQQALYLITLKRSTNSKYYDEYIYLLPTNAVDYDDDTVGLTAKGGLADAYVYINQPNIHIIGAGSPGSVVISPDAAATAGIINLGTLANRIEIANIRFVGTTAANEIIEAIGADDVWIHDCVFDGGAAAASVGINTTNAASCARWIIENNQFINCVTGSIVGYLSRAVIRNNKIIKTTTGALTIGISLLDNTTTADSDGAVIHDNLVLGGINGTTPLGTGISVAAACYGVGVWRNGIGGCTDNLSVTENTAGAHAIDNYTYDQGQGNVAYTTVDDKLPG